jgi:phosphoglucomutase
VTFFRQTIHDNDIIRSLHMALHPLAGKPAPDEILENIPRLVAGYYINHPDPDVPGQDVSFGTSGHRGSSTTASFNEDHILAVSQAVCEYRAARGINGPLYVGMDSHALSEPAQITAVEVFAANDVQVFIQEHGGYTPTPVISQAILTYNEGRSQGLADGVVITPSHNPPCDGGFKYNPPEGGPAPAETTAWIQDKANQLLRAGLSGVKRMPWSRAVKADNVREHDFIRPYVAGLSRVLDMEAIKAAGLHIGVDPLGGSAIAHWQAIGEMHGLNIELVNKRVDPQFSFMRVDKDGKIRMDCSSPYAMAGMIEHKDNFDIACGNDPDTDRHGIVTRSVGLMNPNHYLSVAAEYLFRNRPQWPADAKVGKTVVTSSMMDRVAAGLGREIAEVPVGFKWFVDGLLSGEYGFSCEESAGASFLCKDGKPWSTDKDGIIMCLLAAEIMAVTERDPGERYRDLTLEYGNPLYERLEAPADLEQKAILKRMSPDAVSADTLAGEPIRAKLTRASANDAAIGGLKVTTENGWFAARPSGTENIYKIYTESFKGEAHLRAIQDEAKAIVAEVFRQG